MRKNKTVYSTNPDWRPENEREERPQATKQGTVYLQRQSKGRGGKIVTVIKGLVGDLKSWKKELQQLCGAGGTVKDDVVEIQGDHRQKIAEYLNTKNIKTRLSGG